MADGSAGLAVVFALLGDGQRLRVGFRLVHLPTPGSTIPKESDHHADRENYEDGPRPMARFGCEHDASLLRTGATVPAKSHRNHRWAADAPSASRSVIGLGGIEPHVRSMRRWGRLLALAIEDSCLTWVVRDPSQ